MLIAARGRRPGGGVSGGGRAGRSSGPRVHGPGRRKSRFATAHFLGPNRLMLFRMNWPSLAQYFLYDSSLYLIVTM